MHDLHLFLNMHAGDIPGGVRALGVIEVLGFRLCERDVNAADCVDCLNQRMEIDADITVHIDLEVFPDLRGLHQRAAVAESMREPVPLSLISAPEYRNADRALEACKINLSVVFVQRQQNAAVSARIFRKVIGSVVRSDQQDVVNRIILENIAFRSLRVRLSEACQLLLDRIIDFLNFLVLRVSRYKRLDVLVAVRSIIFFLESRKLKVIYTVKRCCENRKDQKNNQQNPYRKLFAGQLLSGLLPVGQFITSRFYFWQFAAGRPDALRFAGTLRRVCRLFAGLCILRGFCLLPGIFRRGLRRSGRFRGSRSCSSGIRIRRLLLRLLFCPFPFVGRVELLYPCLISRIHRLPGIAFAASKVNQFHLDFFAASARGPSLLLGFSASFLSGHRIPDNAGCIRRIHYNIITNFLRYTVISADLQYLPQQFPRRSGFSAAPGTPRKVRYSQPRADRRCCSGRAAPS